MVVFDEKIYRPDEIEVVLNKQPLFDKLVKNNRKNGLEYYQVPCAFDIETTSFIENNRKRAIMYIWQFGINGCIIIGRTWQEFVEMMNTISEKLMLWRNRRLIVFIHNSSFEFSFIRKWFDWFQVFNMDANRPLYAVTTNGFEFRCTYLLSNASLATVANGLMFHNIEKLIGDLDYSKIRHSKTPITEQELAYCINDVKIVMAYIDEELQQSKSIFKLPYTNTGRVRTFVREKCFTDKKFKQIIKNLTLDEEEYKALKRAFQGGFTHANASYVGRTVKNVTSYDFTSSYPAVMISEQFPMSKAEVIENIDKETFEYSIKNYCCLFDVLLTNVRPKLDEQIISTSRCRLIKNHIENNGRAVYADQIVMTLTEQDWFSINDFYEFDDFKIGEFRRYKRGYLPKPIIECILELYMKKTTLKDVEGEEVEYAISKGMLNSMYGMTVTDVCRDVILYMAETGTYESDPTKSVSEQIKNYNNSKNRFLFYPWGVWVTAYARRNLFSGILECGSDYLYADTDSVKIIHPEKHQKYFDAYNESIVKKIQNVLNFYNIPIEQMKPKNKFGKEKPIGVWDFDGKYERFKTLGAKRYLVEKYNKKHELDTVLTVSGLNKYKFNEYIKEKQIDPFEFFNDEMYIDPEHSGKNTHIYINEETTGTLTDYLGNVATYHEKSGMWMGQSEYKLSIGKMFAEYLLGVRPKRY